MKGCWIANPEGAPAWPDWDKLIRNEVGRVYVMARMTDPDDRTQKIDNDRQVSEAYRLGINSHHLAYGIARDPHWDAITDPQMLANLANADVLRAKADRAVCPYQFDIEYHDAHFVAETIRLWRKLRPTRLTSWTLEPFQGGWFTKELIDRINNDPNLVVVVQNFFGGMQIADPTPGAANLRRDLTSRGIKPDRVKVFYDGARGLPVGWDGCVLSEERLLLQQLRMLAPAGRRAKFIRLADSA